MSKKPPPSASSNGLKSCLKNGTVARAAATEKSVQWDTSAASHPVMALCDFSMSEIEDYWYDPSEVQLIKEQIRGLGRAMNQKDFVLDPETCTRGLEHKQKAWGKRRKLRMAMAREAVLEEDGEAPELIADIYKGFTGMCAEQALRLGLEDERVAVALWE